MTSKTKAILCVIVFWIALAGCIFYPPAIFVLFVVPAAALCIFLITVMIYDGLMLYVWGLNDNND